MPAARRKSCLRVAQTEQIANHMFRQASSLTHSASSLGTRGSIAEAIPVSLRAAPGAPETLNLAHWRADRDRFNGSCVPGTVQPKFVCKEFHRRGPLISVIRTMESDYSPPLPR